MRPGYEDDIWKLEDAVRYVKRELSIACSRIQTLEAEVRELRALVTPLDPGSLPVSGNGEKP